MTQSVLLPGFLLVSAFGFSAPASGAEAANAPAAHDITLIKHIVYIVRENRSFDNYFGTYPNADGATTGTLSTGEIVTLAHAPDFMRGDIAHDWFAAHTAIDGGKMDAFDLNIGARVTGEEIAYEQYYEMDLPNYWQYARHFVLADHMFSSIASHTFPNHLYTIAATSGNVIGNPTGPGKPNGANATWGCDADPAYAAPSLDNAGNFITTFPCYDFPTLADSLQNAGITWHYYAPGKGEVGYSYSTYDAINHIRNSPLWAQNVVPDTQFITDASNGSLPAVSWLVTGHATEHPPSSVCAGENWTVQQINAVMNGPDWNSTAIFITWDDFGGLYDHVPPPVSDRFGLGPRVPLLILSPYAKKGQVISTPYEFSSVLKFVETRFGLPALTSRDANANDMTDSFNFNQTPLSKLVLPQRECPLIANSVFLGNAPLGQTMDSSIRLVNDRSVPLKISKFATQPAGGNFTVVSHCPATVSPGANCAVELTFKPSALGARTATVTITDNDASSPQVIHLTGEGTALKISPSPFHFAGVVQLGSTAKETFAVKNVSGASVSVSSVAVTPSGPYSQTTSCTKSLAPQQSCNITVMLKPTVSGNNPGTLVVVDTSAGGPETVPLTATVSAVKVVPSSLTFPAQAVGTTSAARTISVTNTGDAALTIPRISADSSFSETNTCGSSLDSQASCTISVTFSPGQKGPFSGVVRIFDNDNTSPQQIKVSGTGT